MSDRVYDGATFEHVTREEYERRRAHREELAFRRRPKQGELCAPMVISDCQGGVRGIQSMVDGKFYDSKSQMREHYRRTGHVEVGNDSSLTSGRRKTPKTAAEKEAHRKSVRDTVERISAEYDQGRRPAR